MSKLILKKTKMEKLPPSWTSCKLKEISELIRGVSYKKTEIIKTTKKGFLPILRGTNIDKQLIFSDLVYTPQKKR